MKTASIVLATIIVTSAGVAYAQPVQGRFARLDANNDGKITKEESVAAREKVFERLDRNGDGFVDEEEIGRARQAIADRAAMMEGRLSTRWQKMDADRDGKVSVAEFQERQTVFEVADRNGDGVLTEDEMNFVRGLFGDKR